jgi:hypothetical protein
MIHFGLDPGKFVCFLLGEHTGQHWDICCTLDAIQDHVTSDDYSHIKQILLDGCPAQLTFEEPLSNKLEFISHGNSKSFVENPQLVQKTMNKEDRYSHLIPMDPLLCKKSPYLRNRTEQLRNYLDKFNHDWSLHTPQAKAKQCCSQDRGEGMLSFQGFGSAWEILCLQSRSWEVTNC